MYGSKHRHERRGAIELLDRRHDTDAFDCGVHALNDYLRTYALASQRAGSGRTYVLAMESRVFAYYTLAPAGVSPQGVPARVARGQAAHDIPVILLARLAVDRDRQGHGIGALMLRDAVLRALAGAEVIGGRALLVHAATSRAAGFYRHFGFEPSPTSPMHLYLLMKDIRRTLDASG